MSLTQQIEDNLGNDDDSDTGSEDESGLDQLPPVSRVCVTLNEEQTIGIVDHVIKLCYTWIFTCSW